MTPELILLWLLIGVLGFVNIIAGALVVMAILFELSHAESGKELLRAAGVILVEIIFWYATAKILQWLYPMVSA